MCQTRSHLSTVLSVSYPILTSLSPQLSPHIHTLMILGHGINLKHSWISPSHTLSFSYNHWCHPPPASPFPGVLTVSHLWHYNRWKMGRGYRKMTMPALGNMCERLSNSIWGEETFLMFYSYPLWEAYYVSDVKQGPFHLLAYLILLMVLWGELNNPNFIDEETRAKRDEITCSK